MSTSQRRPGARTFRPVPENLEGRTLLAKVLSGTDIDGDRWVLTLNGPGDLTVINQPGPDGQPVLLGQPASIQQIDVAGADPRASELVGKVTKDSQGDGRVFFQKFNEIGSPPTITANFNGNGLHAVDMPDFWLGYTSTEPVTENGTPAGGNAVAEINIPNGVTTLRFGGVDTTFFPPRGTALNQDNKSSVFRVNLGLPLTVGTSIIVDRVRTSGQAGTPSDTQDSVVFAVGGRLNLFQANAIEGNAQVPPGQFGNIDPNATTSRVVGGTYVISGTGTPPFIATGSTTGSVTGQIGNIRVGGNATNFTTLVFDATGQSSTGARVSNFYIGGETNNVLLSAANGARNLTFGRGMDKTEIRTQTIAHLFANRGALDSQVVTTGQVGQLILGGDVVGSRFLAGYGQDFNQINNNILGVTLQDVVPPLPGNAQSAGALNQVLVAGDVTNSVFAASVQPFQKVVGTGTIPVFESPNSLVLPTGRINAKVEGTISNPNPRVAQQAGNRAFFANHLHLTSGPVIPPTVPEPPYPHPGAPPSGPRIARHLLPSNPDAPSRQAIPSQAPAHATHSSSSDRFGRAVEGQRRASVQARSQTVPPSPTGRTAQDRGQEPSKK